ncbi:MAG TPA: protein kinase [Gemmatimonadaceae bacterium]
MTTATDRLRAALNDRYRIERELGAGGMATVYLAEDLRHDRKVAIKVLKPELAAVLGAERFVVEIKTTAALSHPHILPLFDSGTADGFLYYVMPFIKGETIREKLNRETQFGVDEAVRIAREVADALDYAHRNGVIHRDIKPENILLHDGRAIVMDFGIALAVSAAAGGRMTETGLSLGTPHYMSPEQATAEKEITARSDVYSLASVLYEMLAGQPPHSGGSAQQIIMKIITEAPPPVTQLRKTVPHHVAAALEKALEKLPADRFESARAFADALTNPAFTVAIDPVTAFAPGTARRSQFLIGGLAVALAAALVASLVTRPRLEPPSVARYRISLPGTESTPGTLDITALDVSDDGSRIAWVDRAGTAWTRRRDALDAEPVPGLARDVYAIALSPEGSEIALTRREVGLTIVPLAGGASRVMDAEANVNRGIDWADDGFIYYSANAALARIASSGGSRETVFRVDSAAGEAAPQRPIALGEGRGVLFSRRDAGDSTFKLLVWDARTRRATTLGEGRPLGIVGEYLLSVSVDGTLLARRMDLRSLTPSSEPMAIERDVRRGESFRASPLAGLSRTGVLVFATGGNAGGMRLSRVRLDGKAEPLSAEARVIRGVRVAPDGRRVAYGIAGRIRIHDMAIGSTREVMPSWNSVFDPVWSRDGRRIAFHSSHLDPADSSQRQNLWTGYEVDAEVLAVPRRLFHHAYATGPQSWTPDGTLLAHGNAGTGGEADLVVVRFEGGSAKVSPYLNAPWQETMPRVSPDGRWVAYRASPERQEEIWVRRFPDAAAGAWRISEGSATEPVWSVDGRTLFYIEGANLIAARLRTSPDFAVVSRDVILRNFGFAQSPCCTANYDVLPDGTGLIMALRNSPLGQKDDLIVVENLLTELDRRIPRKR